MIAPDQRGYGRTTGWDADYDGDLRSFSLLNLVRDALGLVSAFGLRSVAAVVGHDFGASVAAWCALVRPDVFRAVTLDERAVRRSAADSVRYRQRARRREGAGSRSCGARGTAAAAQALSVVLFDARSQRRHAELPAGRACVSARLLSPQERRLAGQQAVIRSPPGPRTNWRSCRPTTSWISTRAWRRRSPSTCRRRTQIAACKWLTERELAVSIAAEYARNGFQGGLQWYRCGTSGRFISELEVFSGRTIDVPFGLHLRRERLGHPSAARRAGDDAAPRLHAGDRLST